jgi:hypothetical protein
MLRVCIFNTEGTEFGHRSEMGVRAVDYVPISAALGGGEPRKSEINFLPTYALTLLSS